MRYLLFTGAIAAGIYAVVAILIVVGSRFFGGTLWAPAVIYLGPAIYFIGVAAVNRSAFGHIRSTALLLGGAPNRRGDPAAILPFQHVVEGEKARVGR